MSNFSLRAFFGMDTSNFSQQLNYAGRRVQRFQRLLGTIGIAAGMAQITMWFRDIVKHANDSESGIDKNIDAIQRWSRQLEEFKNSAMNFGVVVVGSLNRSGEWLGEFYSKVFQGMSQAEINAANAASARIDKAKREAESMARFLKKLSDATKKTEESNEEARRKIAFNRLSDLGKEKSLKEQIENIDANIDRHASKVAGGIGVLGPEEAWSIAELEKLKLSAEDELRKLTESRQKRELDLQNQIETVKLDALYEQMDEGEKLLELQRRLLAAEKERAALNPFSASTEDALRLNLKVVELQAQVDAKSLSIAKEKEKLAKDAADKELKTAEQIEKMRRERTSASLGDLESGRFGRGMASRARRVSSLEDRATRARVRGNTELAERLAKQAEGMRDRIPGLRDSERSAEKVMESGFDKTVSAVESVKEEIKKLGESTD